MNGNLKSTYQVLAELSGEVGNATKTWDELTDAEKVSLGTTLAGVNQYKVFSAVMTNFSTAVKASKEALNSEGSALRENEKYMDSLEARTQELKAEIQKLVLSDNLLQKAFKEIISLGTKIIKFFNTVEGKITLVFVAASLFANLIITKIIPYVGALINKNGVLAVSFSLLKTSVHNVSDALTLLEMTLEELNINPYVLAATVLLAIIAGLTIAMYKLSNATENHIKKLEDHKQALEGGKNKIVEYKSRLQDISDEIDEINKKDLNVDKNAQRNIRNLKSEQVELERLIRLQQALNREEQDKANKEAEKVFSSQAQRRAIFNGKGMADKNAMAKLNEDVDLLVGGGYMSQKRYNELIFSGGKTGQYNMYEGLEIATAKLKAYSDEFDKLYNKKEASKHGGVIWTPEDEAAMQTAQTNLSNASDEAAYLADTLQEAYDSADSSVEGYKEVGEVLNGYYESLEEAGNGTKEFIGITDAEEESIEDQIQAWQELQEEIINLANTLGISTYQLERFRDTFNDDEKLQGFLNTLVSIKTELDNASTSIDNIQTAYTNAKTAQEEFNESGTLSLDTFQSLLSISTEYLASLVNENKQIQMNDSVMEDLIGTMKRAKIEEIQHTAAVDVMNYVLGDTENMSQLAKDAIDKMKNAVTEEGNATVIATRQNLDFSASVLSIAQANGELSDEQIKARKAGVEAIIKSYQGIADMINKVAVDTEKSNEKSTKSNDNYNNSLKETNTLLQQQKQELEDKKKQYDSVISYIKKKIQGEIDKLKDEKKAQVDAIKDQIDALKDLKDAESDAIDEQIDKLKEQKEIEEEYWSEKIDAFKKQNEELEEQLEYEELLENLAKAKSKRVRVYKEGQGFVYTDDSNEVDKAQAKIDEYTRKKEYNDQLELLESYKESAKKNYEQQIDDLEKLKKEKEKNYDEQIKLLEQQQKAVEDSYDAQIAYYQAYLDKFTEETDAYENQQNRLLALQLTGIDFEAQGWQTRLDNLANFVEKYNALLGDIHTLEVNGDTGAVTVTETTTTDPPKTTNGTPQATLDKLKANSEQYKINNTNLGQQIAAKNTAEWYAKNYGGKKASGDAFINKDGAYLVGENPNQELIIGSKLNGSLVNLSRGSGVVNSTSTNTLAGILNQLGAMSQNGINMSNSQTRNTNISIGNISLPNVSNGKDFVDYLQDFSLQMTQTAFA